MTKLDCQRVRDQILDEVRKSKFKDLKLVIIQVVGDPASDVYIRNKVKTAESVGIATDVIKCAADITVRGLKDVIGSAIADRSVTGIILQLPLPEHLRPYEREIIDTIPQNMDVDGLTTGNIARLWTGKPGIVPATPGGIMRLFKDDLSGYNVVVINRSKLVGEPLIKLLLDRNATVTVCHSKSENLGELIETADIVISAIGKPKYFGAVMDPLYSSASLWVDVGINRDENGKLCGDIDPTKLSSHTFYTPVPGGVGILTTAQLMANVVRARMLQMGYHD